MAVFPQWLLGQNIIMSLIKCFNEATFQSRFLEHSFFSNFGLPGNDDQSKNQKQPPEVFCKKSCS